MKQWQHNTSASNSNSQLCVHCTDKTVLSLTVWFGLAHLKFEIPFTLYYFSKTITRVLK